MDSRESFKPQPGELPTAPGVYRFSDRQGRTLYVGKAKNLRSRVSNYFGPLASLHPRTQQMLGQATDLVWTVVGSDTEALVLEHTWIKEFSPRYNVEFRDDKSYPYLAVTLADEAPKLIVTRKRGIRGARYFGPYPKLGPAREVVSLLQRAFAIRACSDASFERAIKTGVPCLESQIGRCHGPCSGKVTFEEHRQQIHQLVSFLGGQDRSYLVQLSREMNESAARQDYERAAVLRDQLTAAQMLIERNRVVLRESVNADVFGVAFDEVSAVAHQFIVRAGRIRGERSWILDAEGDHSAQELLRAALTAAYSDSTEVPAEVLLAGWPEDADALGEYLTQAAGHLVSIRVPQRGEKFDVVQSATVNAMENLQRHKLKRANDITTRTAALARLQQALNMPQPPLLIECIDISHLGGTNVVGALVVFEDGLPVKSAYRHYRVRDARDDTAAVHEVVTRRFTRLLEQYPHADARMQAWPQLLLIDGGKPQVEAAHRALQALNITDVAVAGIAKRLEELWLPGTDYPVILPRQGEELFIVQRIRDEAHRFAITHQRASRSKSIKSTLIEIPGLGQKRSAELLKHFKSVSRLKQASAEEIAAVAGIGQQLAATIFDALRAP